MSILRGIFRDFLFSFAFWSFRYLLMLLCLPSQSSAFRTMFNWNIVCSGTFFVVVMFRTSWSILTEKTSRKGCYSGNMSSHVRFVHHHRLYAWYKKETSFPIFIVHVCYFWLCLVSWLWHVYMLRIIESYKISFFLFSSFSITLGDYYWLIHRLFFYPW